MKIGLYWDKQPFLMEKGKTTNIIKKCGKRQRLQSNWVSTDTIV